MTITEHQQTPTARTASPSPRRGRDVVAIISATVAGAVAVNLVIWAIGELAGGSFEFTADGTVESAAPGGVVFLTAVPLAAGMIVTAIAARWWSSVVTVAQVVGSLLAVATIALTVTADFDAESTVALSVMHLALVPFLVIGLGSLRRP